MLQTSVRDIIRDHSPIPDDGKNDQKKREGKKKAEADGDNVKRSSCADRIESFLLSHRSWESRRRHDSLTARNSY